MTSRVLLALGLLAPSFAAQSGGLCIVGTGEVHSADIQTGDYFADALAVDDGVCVVGAEGKSVTGAFQGAAYVFERSGATWLESAVLTPGAPLDANDRYGIAVGISGDFIAIGADGDDDGGFDAGCVYVFERLGGLWTQTTKLVAADASPAAQFGRSLALHGDTLVVSAIRDDESGQDAGAVYVYRESGGAWSLEQKLMASDAAVFSAFGNDVDLEFDRLVVGAQEDDIDGSGALNDEVGAAYVFERVNTTWTESMKLVASNAAQLDRFGGSVALNGDLIAIGAPGQDVAAVTAGAAYLFEWSMGTWNEAAILTANDAAESDLFGISVAFFGQTLAVGSVFDDDGGMSSGSAYVFEDRGTGWAQAGKLVAPDGAAWDRFGCELAIDGRTVLVGAVSGDESSNANSGSLYSFALGIEAVEYGVGLAGSGGFVPRLSVPICPADNSFLSLSVNDGLGGAAGILLAGIAPTSFPIFGGLLLAAPPFVSIEPHVLGGTTGVAGAGAVDLTFPRQTSTGFSRVLFVQAGYIDPMTPSGWSLTPGLEVVLP